MDIQFLESKIEELAEAVHNAWIKKKKEQGYHHPDNCSNGYATLAIRPNKCCLCDLDMIPYSELSESKKELNRATVKTVLNAIKEVCLYSYNLGWEEALDEVNPNRKKCLADHLNKCQIENS